MISLTPTARVEPGAVGAASPDPAGGKNPAVHQWNFVKMTLETRANTSSLLSGVVLGGLGGDRDDEPVLGNDNDQLAAESPRRVRRTAAGGRF